MTKSMFTVILVHVKFCTFTILYVLVQKEQPSTGNSNLPLLIQIMQYKNE